MPLVPGWSWVGKHTNAISPSLGSFVFLGEVITTLELPLDPSLRKTCGSCARCVDVCPTRALRGDYTIDANRCISDLTQRTDAIPRELRPLLGIGFGDAISANSPVLPQVGRPARRRLGKRAIGTGNGRALAAFVC